MTLILQIAVGTCIGVLASNLTLALFITVKQRKLMKQAEELASEQEWASWTGPVEPSDAP